MSELELRTKMYTTLFACVEDVLEGIERKMRIPQSEDWMYTQEVHRKLQAALQKCEDIYVDAEEDEMDGQPDRNCTEDE